MDDVPDVPAYPLYHRSYLLYRLSPLHTPRDPLLQQPALDAHARRLRDQLQGDRLRGVDVRAGGGASDAPQPDRDHHHHPLGPLQRCTWDLLGDDDAWIDRHRQRLPVSPELARGIDIALEYESQSYNALLLRDPKATTTSTSPPAASTALPLMLVKMPAPVRHIFLDYLSTAFDVHVVPLRLSSAFVTSTLETYLRHLTHPQSTQSVQDVIRQLHVQLSFPNATTLLRHLDVTIAARDLPAFLARAKSLKNARDTPFTAALSAYMKKHFALDINHPNVQVSRIACASFVLGTDRLKLMAPDISDASIASSDTPEASAAELAVQEFYTSLVSEATGTASYLPDHFSVETRSSTPSSVASASADRRKRAGSNANPATHTTKRSRARAEKNGRDESSHEVLKGA
ncbi:hypothetical protein GRF29_185g359418 [Pseudopithomyces chartarum]|uniref:Uncharacterized protein n=1 Tax=Pseudopithomyces chartarum TaxID=1892770 RepID=A0AAN6LS59_9PLEO|nr:hypothetical protein GRF29_185g359418 [Pseudopithomyces chartarum]